MPPPPALLSVLTAALRAVGESCLLLLPHACGDPQPFRCACPLTPPSRMQQQPDPRFGSDNTHLQTTHKLPPPPANLRMVVPQEMVDKTQEYCTGASGGGGWLTVSAGNARAVTCGPCHATGVCCSDGLLHTCMLWVGGGRGAAVSTPHPHHPGLAFTSCACMYCLSKASRHPLLWWHPAPAPRALCNTHPDPASLGAD